MIIITVTISDIHIVSSLFEGEFGFKIRIKLISIDKTSLSINLSISAIGVLMNYEIKYISLSKESYIRRVLIIFNSYHITWCYCNDILYPGGHIINEKINGGTGKSRDGSCGIVYIYNRNIHHIQKSISSRSTIFNLFIWNKRYTVLRCNNIIRFDNNLR